MTKGKMRRDAVSPFRDKLWKLFEEQASGMDGADIVLALRQRARAKGQRKNARR
jgi:hypothetical protein